MYNFNNDVLDKKIINEIDDFFNESDAEMVLLSDLGNLIKMEIQNKINLTYNNKRRNISSYIHKNHKSLSRFIKNNTKYDIENIDDNLCVIKS
tara:strand:+ start:171 stop:449 length:279 start_codon:yes stop_codon:yes gene_type:complete